MDSKLVAMALIDKMKQDAVVAKIKGDKKNWKRIRIALAILLGTGLTGCGISADLNLHRVDEYQSSQRQFDRPLKCWFVPCTQTEAQGS